MNHLLLGTLPPLDVLTANINKPALLIDDGPLIAAFQKKFRAALFDPQRHSLDLYTGMDHRRAKAIAYAIYSADPEAGKSTLTIKYGRRKLARMIHEGQTLLTLHGDRKDPYVTDAIKTVDDVLLSPVLRNVLCGAPNFEFGRASIAAQLDRSKLGDDDALIIALILMALYPGHIILSDAGFYLRPMHSSLLRQERLTARLNTLGQVPGRLREELLMIPAKEGRGCTYKEAVVLANAKGLAPHHTKDDNAYNRFVRRTMTDNPEAE